MQVIRDLYNSIISSASKPATIRQLASDLKVSYKTAWNAVSKLKTAGLLTRTPEGYVAANPVTVEDLIRYPFLLRSKHAHGLLLLLNLRPAGVAESARLLGTSPPLIQKILGWLHEDGLIKKTGRKYMLKKHITSLELLPVDAAVSARHLLDAAKGSIKAILYSQGEFLITMDSTSYYNARETQYLVQVMKTVGVRGVVLPHFDWLLYLAGGFEKTPTLAHFMLGVPAYGEPWLDLHEMAAEFLTAAESEESREKDMRRGLAKGLYRKDRKGICITEGGVKKLLSLIRGEVEFAEVCEGISLAKLC